MQGTHDFHNFTADKCSDEGPTETTRVVTRFTCGDVRVNSYGVEYVALIVEGDSFIYHQVRDVDVLPVCCMLLGA
jgi:tRNA U38,U39,U40 pseudouridine synthase TruA